MRRTVKELLIEAKDASELMVDLAYAAVFFGDVDLGTVATTHRPTAAGLPILIGAVLLLVAGLPTARQRLAGWRDRP